MPNDQERSRLGQSAARADALTLLETGEHLLALSEQVVSGRRPCLTAAEARGLVLAGVRAATLNPPDLATAHGLVAVHYRRGYDCGLSDTVLLAAGTHRTATALCPVAHLAAEHLQRPVVVAVDPVVWSGLGLAEIPQAPAPLAGDLVGIEGAAPDDAEEKLLHWLAGVAEGETAAAAISAGRPTATAVLTVGAFEPEVDELVAAAGGALVQLRLRLVRPLPLDLLGRLVADRRVVILGPEGSSIHHEVYDGLRDALDGKRVRLTELASLSVPADTDAAALGRRLAEVVPNLDLVTAQPRQGLYMGATPGGLWSRRLLLEVGTDLASRSTELAHGLWTDSVTSELALVSCDGSASGGLDLLVVVDNPMVDPTPAVRRLKEGGVLVFQCPAAEPLAVWSRLPLTARQVIREKRVELLWFGALGKGNPEDLASRYRQALREVAVGVLGRRSEATAAPSWQGARFPVVPLEPTRLEASLASEPDQVLEARIPSLPEAGDGAGQWRAALRRFHVSAAPLGTEQCWNPDVPLFPAAVLPLVRREALIRSFPYLIPAKPDGQSRPLGDLLDELTEGIGETGILRRMVPAVLEAVGGVGDEVASPRAVVDAAAARVAAILGISPEGRARFESEQRVLSGRVPAEGRVERFHPEAWTGFLEAAAGAGRPDSRRSLRKEWQRLVDELEALLLADDQLSPAAGSAKGLGAGLGSAGRSLVDPSRLAGTLTRRTGTRGLGVERRARVEETRRTLERFLADSAHWPEVWLVHDPAVSIHRKPPGWQLLNPGTEPFGAAAGLFDGLAEQLTRAARAARVARLEKTNDYLPELHEDAIRRLSWEGLEPAELTLIPLLVVYETAGRLTRRTLDAFHRLVRSARPVKVVLAEPETLVQEGPELGGILPDLGYLALGHREAAVFQCPLSQPDRLLEGLRRLVASPRTGIAVLSLPHPGEDRDLAWHRWVTAVHSRAFPVFHYDPTAGESWAARFSLEGNQESGRVWLRSEWDCVNAAGDSVQMSEALTYAHVAVQNPKLRRHFCVIPPEAWDEEQVPLADYLELYRDDPPAALPFIWVLDGEGLLQRALVTRELANAARDRYRAWRLLQELAGVRSVYVDRAVAATEQAVTQRLGDAEEARLTQARRQGAEQAIDRILGRLVDMATGAEPWPIASTPAPVIGGDSTPAAKAPVTAAEPPVETPEPQPVEPETEGGAAEPFIDSFLCTTCNECTNLNPRMFKYNSEKQAYLADSTAGTYAQLVKAAEACPARCIHPGLPRPDDTTATPDLVERARKFN